ncbi:MAG: hypothetical protein DRH93_03285, partial [Deltaproteobacteria bacterium]
MAWLGTWKYRRKITVDHTNIDADLTHFPFPIVLGTSVGQSNQDVSDLFDEVGANSKKIAITLDDEITEIYGEIEVWDDTNEKAVIWVSKHDLVLSSSAETDLYLYYDAAQDDNPLIGDTQEWNETTAITGDSFIGDDDDPPNPDLWKNFGDDDAVIISNKLRFDLSGGSDSHDTCSVQSIFQMGGTDDFSIDFDSTPVLQPATDSSYFYFKIINVVDNTDFCYFSRRRDSTTLTFRSGQVIDGSSEGSVTSGTAVSFSKWRVTRESGDIKFWYYDTSWNLYHTVSGTTYPEFTNGVYLKFELYSYTDIPAITWDIDNFLINSGTVLINPSQQVWDDNFKAVYHMAQDPNGDVADSILDSTINVNHGTPDGTMLTEDLVDGEIGKAIAFDGTDDYIGVPNDFGNSDDFTAEVKVNFDNRTLDNSFMGVGFKYGNDAGKLMQLDSSSLGYRIYSGNQNHSSNIAETALRWAYMVMTCASNIANLYKDLTQIITNYNETPATWETTTLIGTELPGSAKSLIGKIAEVRLSESIRPEAWLKATYYSMQDDLIVFGGVSSNVDTVSTPTIQPLPGTYDSDKLISLQCSTPGASIYYTKDGFDPDESSALYTGPFTLGTYDITVKAIGILSGYYDSDIAATVYSVTAPEVNLNDGYRWKGMFNLGPWAFSKTPAKMYYNQGNTIASNDGSDRIVNPVGTPITDYHKPCGYWFDDPDGYPYVPPPPLDGYVYITGADGNGQQGNGSGANDHNPYFTLVDGANKYYDAQASRGSFTTLLANNGLTYCAGTNDDYRTGYPGSAGDFYTFRSIDSEIWDKIQIASSNSWAWKNGETYVSGDNSQNQSCIDDHSIADVIGFTKINHNFEKVATDHHTIALDASGKVWVCGGNQRGQLGLNHTTGQEFVVPCTSLTHGDYVAVGDTSSFVINGGSLYSCGWNYKGELG